jgi:hypothetical protein
MKLRAVLTAIDEKIRRLRQAHEVVAGLDSRGPSWLSRPVTVDKIRGECKG